MWLLNLHMMVVFCWAVFLSGLAQSVRCNQNSKILAVLSFIFMLSVLLVGTKLMLLFPSVAKSGMWIHVKLSIDILAMLVNIYLVYVVFKNKTISQKLSDIIFWIIIIIFTVMYALTLFKPF
jgi:putative membrane protein